LFSTERLRIRIRRVPPTAFLEGIDLRPFQFRDGYFYDVDKHVAEVLIAWGYADYASRAGGGGDPQPA
jgi:hypothetical protein